MKTQIFSLMFLIMFAILVQITKQSSEFDYEPLQSKLRFRRDKTIGLMPFPRVGKSYDNDAGQNVRPNLIPFMRVGRRGPAADQPLFAPLDLMLVAVPSRWSQQLEQQPDGSGSAAAATLN